MKAKLDTNIAMRRIEKTLSEFVDPDDMAVLLATNEKIDGQIRFEAVFVLLHSLLLPELRVKLAAKLAELEKKP